MIFRVTPSDGDKFTIENQCKSKHTAYNQQMLIIVFSLESIL